MTEFHTARSQVGVHDRPEEKTVLSETAQVDPETFERLVPRFGHSFPIIYDAKLDERRLATQEDVDDLMRRAQEEMKLKSMIQEWVRLTTALMEEINVNPLSRRK